MNTTTLLPKERRVLKANLHEFYTPTKAAFSPSRLKAFCKSHGMQRVFECFQFSKQSKAGIHFDALLANRTCLYCDAHVSSLPAQVCKFCLKTPEGRRFAYEQGLVRMRETKNNPARQQAKRERSIERTGYAHHMQNPEFLDAYRDHLVETTGYANPSFNPEVVAKRKQTSLDRRGVPNPMQDPAVQRKIRKTLKATRGVTNPMQDPEVKAKCKETWSSNFEGGHPLRDPKVKAQLADTCMERYGVPNPLLNKAVRDKAIETNLRNAGVPYSWQIPSVKAQIKKTNLARYGYTHPSKNPEHFASVQKFKQRTFISDDGRTFQLMGYEPEAFQLLASIYGSRKVKPHSEKPVALNYRLSGKDRVFHPDFSVGNLPFEVKSEYTLFADFNRNRAKSKHNPEVRFLVIWKLSDSFEYLLLPLNWHLLSKSALKKRLLNRRSFMSP